MEKILALLASNTILLVAVIIIAVMIIIAIVKKFMKLFLVAVLIVGLYVVYLAYSGQKIPTNSEEILRHGSEKIEQVDLDKLSEEGAETLKRIKQKGNPVEMAEKLIPDSATEQ